MSRHVCRVCRHHRDAHRHHHTRTYCGGCGQDRCPTFKPDTRLGRLADRLTRSTR